MSNISNSSQCSSLIAESSPNSINSDLSSHVSESMKTYYELADTLYNHTQIPYKYFEVGSLLLINVSNSEDPNRFQEYAVHKRTATGGFSKVESITVNGSSTTVLSLTKLIKSIDKKSIEKFSENARIFDEETSLNEFEDFKVRFEKFEKLY